jgi:hypothetical protein
VPAEATLNLNQTTFFTIHFSATRLFQPVDLAKFQRM